MSRLTILSVGLVVLIAGLAAGQPSQEPSAQDAVASTGYLIGPADVLRVHVWREPDLTVDATVRLDGMITVPLLGDVRAAGQPPSKLAESLMTALERYVESPRVTVIVSKARSARFFVVGQVVQPGEFPLLDRTTVIQALALAGGFREFAKPEDIVIVRQDQTVVRVDYKRIASGKDISQNVPLAPGDTMVVP